MTESSETGGAKPRLYHAPSSYYSTIARLALAEGGISYERVFVDIHFRLGQVQPDYARLNPNMTVRTKSRNNRPLSLLRAVRTKRPPTFDAGGPGQENGPVQPVRLPAHDPPPAVTPAVAARSPSRTSRAAMDAAPAVAPAIASSPLHIRDFGTACLDLARRKRRGRRGGGRCRPGDQETGESGENSKLRHGFCPFMRRERPAHWKASRWEGPLSLLNKR